MKNLSLVFLIFLMGSCASLNIPYFGRDNVEQISLKGYLEYDEDDYIDHLISFHNAYREGNRTKVVSLNRGSEYYLKRLVKKIVGTNELFFDPDIEASFTIIRTNTPFHFSLPGRRFYLSTGLLKKYVKNEEMLYCALVFELIRSEKNIYTKTTIIPTGNLDTNRLLSLLRLHTPDKVEIHKWSYYLLKRSGVNTDAYLSWLQVKNRNSLDFALQLGDTRSISREEALYKAFLIEIEKDEKRSGNYKGSSRSFYRFLRDIKV